MLISLAKRCTLKADGHRQVLSCACSTYNKDVLGKV